MQANFRNRDGKVDTYTGLNWNGCLVMSVNKFHFLYGKTLNCVRQTAKLHAREHNVSKLVSYRACRTRLIFSLQIPLWSAYTWLVPLMRSENHPPVFMTGITTHALCSCLTDSFLVVAHRFIFPDGFKMTLIYNLFAKLIRKTKMQLPIDGLTKMSAHSFSLCVCCVHPTC